MSEDGGGMMEGLGVGEIKEASPAQIEEMKENLRKASEAMKKVQKDETKKRKKEKNLVDLIVTFLQTGDDKEILSLVVLLLEQKVAIGFIISILSLYYLDIEKTLYESMEPQEKELFRDPGEKEKELENEISKKEIETFDNEHLPEFIKIRINEWVRSLFISALEEKTDIIKYLYPEGNLLGSALRLTTIIVQKFMNRSKIETNSEQSKDFSLFILGGLKNQISTHIEIEKVTKGI